MSDEIVYKVLTAREFAALQAGMFRGSSVDIADGFVHFSTGAQLTETVARHFAGQRDLTVAALAVVGFGDALRWEESHGGQVFPHLYALFALQDVIAHCPLSHAPNGAVRLPAVLPTTQNHTPRQSTNKC